MPKRLLLISVVFKILNIKAVIIAGCLILTYYRAEAQKSVYIPNEWSSGGIPYSMERSYQSENFVLFWGEKAGTDPTHAPTEIRFTPSVVAGILEDIYRFFIDEIGMIPPDMPNISTYKFIVVLNETWNPLPDGRAIFTGWAFGSHYDSRIGAMWIHPRATSKFTLAHEFTHMMQCMAFIEYPGHGFINNDYVGSFWETHANFIALKAVPDKVESTDPARFLNTQHFYWSSARHHYTNWMFLKHIEDEYGMELINRLWRESDIGEHPLITLRRLRGMTQDELNDEFGKYAMKNVVFDYSNGDEIRHTLKNEVDGRYITRRFTILEEIDRRKGRYIIPRHLAPQDYGYNVVRLFPQSGIDERRIAIRFRGHQNQPSGGAGWRSGFVFVGMDGTTRYSELFRNDFEAEFTYNEGDEIYFVVTAAPAVHHNYAWELGWPRIYRFPWEIRIHGAIPEGFEPGYNAGYRSAAGSPHANGGGFVASSARVASTVYVGPQAVVTGSASITGNVKVLGRAVVKDNATVSDNAVIDGFAVVGGNARVRENSRIEQYARVNQGADISGSAVISASASVFNSSVSGSAVVTDNASMWGAGLSGTVYVGGDAEHFGTCSAGKYLQIWNLGNRGCDGLFSHPLNSDINPVYNQFSDVEMSITTDITSIAAGANVRPYKVEYILHAGIVRLTGDETRGRMESVLVTDMLGRVLSRFVLKPNNNVVEIKTGSKGVTFINVKTTCGVFTEKVLFN